ncbi:hypothetical protein [Nocardia sp. NBC_01388]|uniref:hypothetical protein n=1 Tax=Nocardia sp. NBC_01388 TaxID=2903596 RepID=UPI003243C2B6
MPSRVYSIGRTAVQVLLNLAGRNNPMAGEPNRSSWQPERMRKLLGARGFDITTDVDQLSIACGLDLAIERDSFLAGSRVAVADRR